MADEKSHREFSIPPESRGQMVWLRFMTAVIVFFIGFAIYDLVTGQGWVAPLLWLGIVSLGVWSEMMAAGGVGRYVLGLGRIFFGREFVEIEPAVGPASEIRFGFEFFGRRYLRRAIPVEKVRSLEWSPGQGGLYWNVALWFASDNPKESSPWKPGQYVHIVGPMLRQKQTDELGRALVGFLQSGGVTLVEGEKKERLVCYDRV